MSSAKKSNRQARGKTVNFGIYEALFTKKAVEFFRANILAEDTEWKDPMFSREQVSDVLAGVDTKINNLTYFANPPVTNGAEVEGEGLDAATDIPAGVLENEMGEAELHS